jgi:hypothetical protein
MQLPGIDEAGARAVKVRAAELAVEQRRREAEAAAEAARAAQEALAASPAAEGGVLAVGAPAPAAPEQKS